MFGCIRICAGSPVGDEPPFKKGKNKA